MLYDFIISPYLENAMSSITISSKYQVVIPQEIREQLNLKRGQKMAVIVKGGVVSLIPEKPLKSFRGFLKGMNTRNVRDEKDR
jgi:AbrB family looped-hinge helix DNA binding protein